MTSMEIIIDIIESHPTFKDIENDILIFKSYIAPNKENIKINKALKNIKEFELKHFYCDSSKEYLYNIISKIFNILQKDEKIKVHDNNINIYMFNAGIYFYSNHPIWSGAYKLTKNFICCGIPYEYNLIILDMICFYLTQLHQINILFSNGKVSQK